MEDNCEKNEIRLWNLLENGHEVKIPEIQRDYIHGEKGKAHIRKSFLKNFKDGLEKKKITLHYIYGVENGNTFELLDGQQRLTTLWLLHWFLAFKSGQLKEQLKKQEQEQIKKQLKEQLKEQEQRDALSRFSYATRTSSEEFCKKICENMVGVEPFDNTLFGENGKYKTIAEYIQDQTWFYTGWRQDPTIRNMLVTLSGDGATDDNIESVFSYAATDPQDSQDHYIKLFNILIGTQENEDDKGIVFRKFSISPTEVASSDDLYIKMNSRGKALSDFEQLKTAILDYVAQNDDNSKDDLAMSIDTTWMDLFWKIAVKQVKDKVKIVNDKLTQEEPEKNKPKIVNDKLTQEEPKKIKPKFLFDDDAYKKYKSRASKGQFDELIYYLINRFVVMNILCSGNEKVLEDPSYVELSGARLGCDTLVKYKEFEIYTEKNETDEADKNKYLNVGQIMALDKVIRFINNLNLYVETQNEEGGLPSKDRKKREEIRKKIQKKFIPNFCFPYENKKNADEDYIINNCKTVNAIPIPDAVKGLTLKDRVYFCGIYRYLLFFAEKYFESEPDESKVLIKCFYENFDRWYRLVDRLVKNPSIDTKDAMLKRVKVVNAISKDVFDKNIAEYDEPWIYQGIIKSCEPKKNAEKADKEDSKKDAPKADKEESKLDAQIKEEYEKAIIIVGMSDPKNTSGNKKMKKWGDWRVCEKAFKEAEEKEVCNGSIRFLYRNADGNLPCDNSNADGNLPCDNSDDQKLDLPEIEKNFYEKIDFVNDAENENWIYYIQKILSEYIPPNASSEYDPFEAIRDKFLFTSKLYDDRAACWKYDILCNSKMSQQVDKFLRWYGKMKKNDNASQQLTLIKGEIPIEENYNFQQEYKAFINSPELLKRLFTADMESEKDKGKFSYKYRYARNQVDHAYAVYKKNDQDKSRGVVISRGMNQKISARWENGILYEYLDNNRKYEYDNFNGFIWGLNVELTVKGQTYTWYANDEIVNKKTREKCDFNTFCSNHGICKNKIRVPKPDKYPQSTQDEN